MNNDENLTLAVNTLIKNCEKTFILKDNDSNRISCTNKMQKKVSTKTEAINYLIDNFKVFLDIKKNTGLMTGYYEPEVYAFRKKKKFSYPIYRNPKEFGIISKANLSREEINKGALDNKGLEIAWVEDEIEAFFLQIQGSGRLRFSKNKVIKIRYSGNNGKKYTSIGKVLIKKGILKKEEVTMLSIKNWLYKNPQKARKIMEYNERYIFFETYKGNIKGSSLINLVPKVSVAVDERYIQSGTPLIIEDLENKRNIFLALAHDKGNAIKGEQRIDLFTGYGKEAELLASGLKRKIRVWTLFPKTF